MKNLFTKIFGSHHKAVPENIQNELYSHFPGAMNVEWEYKQNYYEAIFYLNDVEHISQISESGELTEYKKNLWPSELPGEIGIKCHQQGEVMNCIVIFRQKNLFYEVIIRDSEFNRKLLLFDESSNLLNAKKL